MLPVAKMNARVWYAKLTEGSKPKALFGIAMVANGCRANIVIPTDNESMPVNMYGIAFAGSGLAKTKSINYMKSWIEPAISKLEEKGTRRSCYDHYSHPVRPQQENPPASISPSKMM